MCLYLLIAPAHIDVCLFVVRISPPSVWPRRVATSRGFGFPGNPETKTSSNNNKIAPYVISRNQTRIDIKREVSKRFRGEETNTALLCIYVGG
jgi:hypothetical protein